MQANAGKQFERPRSGRRVLHTGAQPTPQVVVRPAANSNLEKLAMWSDQLADRSHEVAGHLLAASTLTGVGEVPALQPLWAEEAMHRAYSMLRLLNRVNSNKHLDGPAKQHTDCCIAARLSRSLLELQAGRMQAKLPCSAILTQIARDLVLLFAGRGDVYVATAIDCVTLSAYRRRALVLLANELISNALTHAFPEHRPGIIEVSLRVVSPRRVELQVSDDGIGLGDITLNSACSVAGGLASLLGGDLRYYSTGIWSTRAELGFPLDEP